MIETSGSACPFCALPSERVVWQDDTALVIRDSFPVSKGHTLILPKRHIRSLFEASPAERDALLAMLEVARAQLEKEHRPDGYNIGINDGVAAGQTVMHLHIHLIPRYVGDVQNARGGVRHCIPGKGDYKATP